MPPRVAVPLLRREQYAAFGNFLGRDLPDVYDDWLLFVADHLNELRRKRHLFVEVEIDPTEFSAWCTAHATARSRKALFEFAREMANDPGGKHARRRRASGNSARGSAATRK